MPLSGYGLWLAEMTAPRSAPRSRTSQATAGVGTTPARSVTPPADATPAASASSSIGPERRGSRPTTTRGRATPRSMASRTTARPSDSARSGVRSAFATPRTPSVPKKWRRAKRLALGELRLAPGLLEAGLLALDLAGIAGQEAGALEVAAQRRVGLAERAGDAVAQGAGLAGDTAAVQVDQHVEVLLLPGQDQRAHRQHPVRGAREVLLDGAAVADDLALTGNEADARDRGLALAGAAVDGLLLSHLSDPSCRHGSAVGCCASWGCAAPA